MKKLLLAFGFIILTLVTYAQSGQDFSSFGDELLVNKNKIEIYPNPSVDFLNVQIENSNLTDATIIIYNIIGNKFEIKAESIGIDEYRIDVRSLPAGYYLLSVKDVSTKFSKTFKFLKR